MVGHKLGEFSPTRKYTGRKGHTAEDKAAQYLRWAADALSKISL
jgi:hypothetical protein